MPQTSYSSLEPSSHLSPEVGLSAYYGASAFVPQVEVDGVMKLGVVQL